MSDPDLTDLQAAVLTFDPEAVRSALDRCNTAGKERPWHCEDGCTPLHTICKSGQTHTPPWPPTPSESLEWDGGGGVEWEAAPTPPAPPWSGGCGGEGYHRGRMCVVYMLCDAGLDVNAVDEDGLTPLHYAARRGDAALCDALLQCGGDLEAQHSGRPLWVEVAAAAQREALLQGREETDREEEEEEEDRIEMNERRENTKNLKNMDTEDHKYENKVENKEEEEEERHYENTREQEEEEQEQRPYENTGEHKEAIIIGAPPAPGCPPRSPARAVCRLFRFYWPGLWRAVACEDVNKVRQLVNAWCKVDLRCGGVTLLDLARSTANETITSLLHTIQPSLALVHACLADNLPAIHAILASPARPKLNQDIRRLSERAAPLLYFAVRAGHHRVARELCRHGASCLVHMLADGDGDGTGRCPPDSPVVFEALDPWLPPALLPALLPPPGTPQAAALGGACSGGGSSVLWVAVQRGVAERGVEALVCVGGPALLCQRDASGLTPHDLALTLDRPHLATLLDRHATAWLTRPARHPGHRTALALGGYGRLKTLAMCVEEAEGVREEVEAFMEEYSKCQVFLAAVFRAVREAVPEGVLRRLLAGYHSDTFHLGDVLWLGREEGDGMPLLHWAALHGNTAALRLILKPPQPTPPPPHLPLNTRFCVDEVRDPWRRTPLHYALGLQEGAALAAALMDAGCSEHTLDRHGREPLDFRDVRGSPALEALLGDLRDRVYRDPHPDPWNPEVLRAHQEHQRRQRFHQHQHHHHHHHHHPAKFPTPPSSNFYWPLPRTVVEEEEEEEEEKKRGWSVCKVM